jgi:hypothetical protein
MTMHLVSTRQIVASLVIAFAIVLASGAQQPAPAQAPSPAGQQVRTTEQQFKNIQVLKGFPASQLNLSMHVIESSLGVDCEYCHDQKDRAKDDLKPKQIARKMISMVLEINKNTFEGQQVVTCYTCHRGSPQPSNVIALPIPNPMIEHPAPASAPLPTADQIISKYIQALGGEQALRKVSTRVITGTRNIPTGPGGEIPTPAKTAIYQKAPNMVVNVFQTDKVTLSEGYNGATAWAQNVAGVVADLPSPDQERAKRAADMYEPIDLKTQYAKMEVRGIEKLNGRDTYLLVGFPQNDNPEQLYFDVQTGLLARKVTAIPTLFGDNPVRVDYSDYRNTGSGVKIPFLVEMVPGSPRSELWTTSTLRVDKVQDNVAIDDAKFTKPASKAPAAQ